MFWSFCPPACQLTGPEPHVAAVKRLHAAAAPIQREILARGCRPRRGLMVHLQDTWVWHGSARWGRQTGITKVHMLDKACPSHDQTITRASVSFKRSTPRWTFPSMLREMTWCGRLSGLQKVQKSSDFRHVNCDGAETRWLSMRWTLSPFSPGRVWARRPVSMTRGRNTTDCHLLWITVD